MHETIHRLSRHAIAAAALALTGCATLANHPTGFKPANYAVAAGTLGFMYWGAYAGAFNSKPVVFHDAGAEVLRRHAIYVGEHSRPLDVRLAAFDTLGSAAYDAYLDSMMVALDHSRAKRILIYVHGGMNRLQEGPERNWALYQAMSAAGDTAEMFPIFVNWESGMHASYVQHLIHIRQGQYENSLWWKGVMPYVYSVDFMSGVLRSPFPVGSAIANRVRSDADLRRNERAAAMSAARRPASRVTTLSSGMRVDSGYFLPRRTWFRRALSFPAAPFQFAAAPFVDMFGDPAWANMHRRTSELFRRDSDEPSASYRESDGALAVLLRRLERYVADTAHRRRDSLDVVLIGHSMGAIVLTRFIRDSRLPISNIVFMASAATVREFETTVVPYLEAHPRVQFYNLTLHKSCEILETHVGGLSPNGSLLVWLDDYLTHPETPDDYMVGRWRSLPAVLERVPPSVAPQVTFKGFGYRDPTVPGSFGAGNSKPCQHGEFSDTASRFWRPAFWQVR